jgi:hypothetical protein
MVFDQINQINYRNQEHIIADLINNSPLGRIRSEGNYNFHDNVFNENTKKIRKNYADKKTNNFLTKIIKDCTDNKINTTNYDKPSEGLSNKFKKY